MILYLHGFKSSPASTKARQLGARAAAAGVPFACPQLPPSPRAAIGVAQEIIAASATPVVLVGSSLGGYYATWLAEQHNLPAILVNPAVVAYLDLAPFVGHQTAYHGGESFEFTNDHVAELRALDVPVPSRPERYWLLLETGDEVLDYRLAVARYAGARQTVLAGGDHSFTAWRDYLDAIVTYKGIHPVGKERLPSA